MISYLLLSVDFFCSVYLKFSRQIFFTGLFWHGAEDFFCYLYFNLTGQRVSRTYLHTFQASLTMFIVYAPHDHTLLAFVICAFSKYRNIIWTHDIALAAMNAFLLMPHRNIAGSRAAQILSKGVAKIGL